MIGDVLTPCERAVLRGIVAGKQNKAIARDRGRSIGTIKVQVRSLLEKSGARSRSALVAWAIRSGAA